MTRLLIWVTVLLLAACGKTDGGRTAQPMCADAEKAVLVAWSSYEAEVQAAYDAATTDIPHASTIETPEDMQRAQARIRAAADLRLKLNPIEEALVAAEKGQLTRELVNAVATDSSDRYRAAMETSAVAFRACASD